MWSLRIALPAYFFFLYSGLDCGSSSTPDFKLDFGHVEIDPIKVANILMQFFWDESNQYTYKKWKKPHLFHPPFFLLYQ